MGRKGSYQSTHQPSNGRSEKNLVKRKKNIFKKIKKIRCEHEEQHPRKSQLLNVTKSSARGGGCAPIRNVATLLQQWEPCNLGVNIDGDGPLGTTAHPPLGTLLMVSSDAQSHQLLLGNVSKDTGLHAHVIDQPVPAVACVTMHIWLSSSQCSFYVHY